MAHAVTFHLPRRTIGREDIEFAIDNDGVRSGTRLRASEHKVRAV